VGFRKVVSEIQVGLLSAALRGGLEKLPEGAVTTYLDITSLSHWNHPAVKEKDDVVYLAPRGK
jgi:hypothetical protein